MKIRIPLLVSFVLIFAKFSFTQTTKVKSYRHFNVLPSEKVYVSINTPLLFTGEYLFYKVYCLNNKTKQPSKISKIAYVELINEDLEVIFSHKIRLEKSQGQGDFFVPTKIPSGNYKLVAYTRWMKNGSINLFFQDDIFIINPYQSNQDALLAKNTKDTLTPLPKIVKATEDKRFVISTDKKSYPKQSKVKLTITNFRGASGYGNYNISVRKKETIANREKHTPESYINWHQKQASNLPIFYKKIRFEPELEGELIKGRILARDEKTTVIGKKIGISIPGKDFQLKVIHTDSTGIFRVSINKDYTENIAVFQLLDESKDGYLIKLEKDPNLNYSALQFEKIYIDESMKDDIITRSVHNQIENSFFSVKPDTVRLDKLNDPYDGAYVETVNLDEFTRFKTLRETLVEIVPNVWTKKNKKGEFVFKVRSFDETYEESEFNALVYIDGILIGNPNDILDFDTRTVEKINTVREKYRLDGKTYFGMVNIQTKEGNYFNQLNGDGITKIDLIRPRPLKKYFIQTYDEKSNKRIPDFRHQLLWKPQLSLNEKEVTLSFYTSEVAGDYEIILEGFSIYGRPVILKNSFVVE